MKVKILETEFDNLTMDEAVEEAWRLMAERRGAYVVTPNPEMSMVCREDAEALEAVNGADLVIADGVGIIYGAKIMKTPLKEKIPGIDLTARIFERMAAEGKSCYLFGARPGVAEKAGENLAEKYPGLVIAGCHDGYFADDSNIVRRINEAAPDLLLVCLGMPKQEKWMRSRKGDLNVGLMIGAGGSLDVFAGVVERAPESWQKLGLEWLYRLKKEPWRLGRMMRLPKYLFAVIKQKISTK